MTRHTILIERWWEPASRRFEDTFREKRWRIRSNRPLAEYKYPGQPVNYLDDEFVARKVFHTQAEHPGEVLEHVRGLYPKARITVRVPARSKLIAS